MKFDSLRGAFTSHPASVGESYLEHLHSATSFAVRLVIAGLACLVHGLLPWTFTRTGSNAIRELHDRMVVNRARQSPGAAAGAASRADA
jgi:Family of unknown function (DUF6356)